MKILTIGIVSLLVLGGGANPVLAKAYVQKDRLFSIDVPQGWHWFEYPEEVVITLPDGKTMGIDIQFLANRQLSVQDIPKTLKESNEKMINEGIKAHGGTLIADKEIHVDGVYARELDFNPDPHNPIPVTYIALFNKGYAFTITYSSAQRKDNLIMQKAVGTLQFIKD